MSQTAFVDTAGREWVVNITVNTAREVKRRIGVDLVKLLDKGGAGLAELTGNVLDFVDTLFVVVSPCHPEITDVQFGESLAGDCIETAAGAFVQGLLDFSPNPKARAGLRRIFALTEAAMNEIQAETAAEIEAPEMPGKVKAVLKDYLKSQVPSASTPAPTPTGN
jgi:hypothetical protein